MHLPSSRSFQPHNPLDQNLAGKRSCRALHLPGIPLPGPFITCYQHAAGAVLETKQTQRPARL